VKRFIFLGMILTMALGACSGGGKVGTDDLTKFQDEKQASASPTATKSRTRSPSPTPSAKKTQEQKFDYCTEFGPQRGGNITVVIKTTADSFDPPDIYLLQGCKITFKNLDAERAHSFISGSGTSDDDGTLWKSPALKKGDKPFVVDTTNIDPDTYQCHDGEVPYGVVCSVTIGEVPS